MNHRVLLPSAALVTSLASGVGTAAELPVITTEPAISSVAPGTSQPRSEITYSNIWADDKGQTHISKCVLKGLKLQTFAKPAAPYWVGIAPEEIEKIVFSVLPAKWFGDWHRAPGPQWVVTLSGQWEVHTTDGSTLIQGPGEFQFNSDENAFAAVPGGHVGHTAREIGDVPNVRLVISLKRKPGQSYTNQPCVL